MWEGVVTFIFDFLNYIGDFWTWATTPIKFGSYSFAPIMILSGGAFITIIGFWVFKLINPLS